MNISTLGKPCIQCLLTFSIFIYSFGQVAVAQVSFNSSGLSGASIGNPTSLQFGPDGRLYISEQGGAIKAFTIDKIADNNYQVSQMESINLVKQIPNHFDDGTAKPYNINTNSRQVTGLYVSGTAANPVIYVSSSDNVHGGPDGDSNLDTNSGIISRLSWNGANWEKMDLVRGLPRSEENHSTNGLQLDEVNNVLYVAQGGNTNAGSTSYNFAFQCEYALSGAILSIDLSAIDALPTQGSGTAHPYKYDIPTLDDPSRPNNSNDSDEGDPFGGNDGLNQAKIVAGGPVQVYASGFRNPYDLVLTSTPGKDRRLYAIDNGANAGWGGHPDQEGPEGNVTNNYVEGEPGSTNPGPNDPMVNNLDGVHFIGHVDTNISGSYYGGHPNPTRANPAGAGLYTHTGPNDTGTGVWRTSTSDPLNPLPSDWPPLPVEYAHPVEGDYQNPGETDQSILTFNSSTNGVTEYTSTAFNGALQGSLIAAGFEGDIYWIKLNESGDASLNSKTQGQKLNQDPSLASGFGSKPLDITTQSDDEIFPGTIWAATYGSNTITIFEPATSSNCTGAYDNSLDEDGDCYSNADEIDNGTDPCSAASKPNDFNGNCVSDLNDPDDDGDGITDTNDFFVIDANNGVNTNLPVLYTFGSEQQQEGFFGLGFTGLMNNYTTDYLDQYDEGKMITGGAAGIFTLEEVPEGDALEQFNNQQYAFQFGVNVNSNTNPFTVKTRMHGPFFNGQIPQDHQSQGLYIGNGDQDNYLKIVLNANGGVGGIQVVYENNGAAQTSQFPIENIPSSSVDVSLTVDPTAGTVQPGYALSSGSMVPVGDPIALQGQLLTAVQGAPALAIGVIATSRGSGTPFNAGWDFIEVTEDQVEPPADGILFRVNAGGSEQTSADGSSPNYEEDTPTNPSPYVNAEETANKVFITNNPITLDPSVPANVPASLFQSQRYNGITGTPALEWDFPVQAGSELDVQLYFAETFFEQEGSRVFDIVIEGTVQIANYDIYADVGHDVGVMKSFNITMSDNNLDIDLTRVTQNPAIQGIEIISGGGGTTNQSPVVANPIPDQSATEGETFSYTFPSNTFSDPNGDALSFSATQANGTALPAWLSFTPSSQTFSGTPASSDVGSYSIVVTADDGNGGSVDDTFTLTVNGIGNQSPVVANPIPDQSATEGEAFSYTFPLNTFSDPDGDALTYTADQSDGSALPSWLSFESSDPRTFSGTPGIEEAGNNYHIVVTANDGNGGAVDDIFILSVQGTGNQSPVVVNPIPDQAATENVIFSYTFPENSFSDPDGDALTYSASQADGSALPGWLSFEESNPREFKGTPTTSDVGSYSIVVSASDNNGGTTEDNFALVVQEEPNQNPEVANPIPDQWAVEAEPFSYTFPENTFSDPDGDALTYTASQSNGKALPDWLSFEAVNPREFDGTPEKGDTGNYQIAVEALDSKGGSVTATFAIRVYKKPNQAPSVSNPLVDQETAVLSSFSYTFPENTFSDPDGDALSYTATQANGKNLPYWLDFDAANRSFSGSPGALDFGNYYIEVSAMDYDGATATDVFIVKVKLVDIGIGLRTTTQQVNQLSAATDDSSDPEEQSEHFIEADHESELFTPTLYPNPADENSIHIQFRSIPESEVNFSIYDMRGALIKDGITHQPGDLTREVRIDISTLKGGNKMYFINITSNDKDYPVMRFIKR